MVTGSVEPFWPLMTTLVSVSGEVPFANAVRLKIKSAPLPVAPALVLPPRTASPPTETVPAVLFGVQG
jgi:hypothetical protein